MGSVNFACAVAWIFSTPVVVSKRPTCEIVVSSEQLSQDNFAEVYQEKQPVLLEGAAAQWSQLDWRPEAFVQRYGDHFVEVRNDASKILIPQESALLARSMKLNDYMQDLQVNVTKPPLPIFESTWMPLTKSIHESLDLHKLAVGSIRKFPVVSFGRNATGVGFHSHEESWLAQIHGRKAWFLVEAAAFDNVSQVDDGGELRWLPCRYLQERPRSLFKKWKRCLTKPGDILYLPSNHFHATCNVDAWTFALGGQQEFSAKTYSAAHIAALAEDAVSLRKAVETESADILNEPRGELEETALHAAALAGHVQMLKLLTSMRADPLVSTRSGMPIHAAARWGQVDALAWLASTGHGPESQRQDTLSTPLHTASMYSHTRSVEWLLRQPQSQKHLTDLKGRVAMHYAAANGHVDTVRLLLAHRSSAVLPRTVEGFSPLELAKVEQKDRVAQLLERELSIAVAWTQNSTFSEAVLEVERLEGHRIGSGNMQLYGFHDEPPGEPPTLVEEDGVNAALEEGDEDLAGAGSEESDDTKPSSRLPPEDAVPGEAESKHVDEVLSKVKHILANAKSVPL